MNNTIEKALKNFDYLVHLEEINPVPFECKRLSQCGIFLVSNLRFSFFFTNNEGEESYEHMVYSLISKISFFLGETEGYIDIHYAYTKQRFHFEKRSDLIKIRQLIEKYIPEERIEKLEVNDETVSKTKPGHTQQLPATETKPLISIDDVYIKKHNVKKRLFTSIKLVLTITALYMFFINAETLGVQKYKNMLLKGISYSFNFIQVNQCESQMFVIAKHINDYNKNTNKLPDNFTVFLRSNFKNAMETDPAKDPWGSFYVLKENKNSFIIMSYGADQKKYTYDDILREFKKVKTNSF